MKIRRPLALFIVLSISLTPILPSFSISFVDASYPPESHLIEGVPYVGQTGPYCSYASAAMAIKYHEMNATEHEVLYNSGMGYSLRYPTPYLKYQLREGSEISYLPTDREFLANLYSLSYEKWQANSTLSEEERWNEYWVRVKENITKDVPLITTVFSFVILADEFNVKIQDKSWNSIPKFLTFSGHAIVIVGFNESNQTVCFNDPQTALFGHPEYGIYKWININEFKIAISKASPLTGFSYTIEVFKETLNDSLSQEEMFKIAHKRNIERMRGNRSAYDEKVFVDGQAETELGINALKAFKKDLDSELINQLKIIQSYKRTCSKLHLPLQYRAFKIMRIDEIIRQWVLNFYYQHYIQKLNISQYLLRTYPKLNDPNLSELCKNEAILFGQEAEAWSEFAELYNQFAKRGIFLSYLRGLIIIQKMTKVLEDIITIEQKIIDNSI